MSNACPDASSTECKIASAAAVRVTGIRRSHRGLVACKEKGEGLGGGFLVRDAAAVLVLAVDHEAHEGARLHAARLLASISSMRFYVHRWSMCRLDACSHHNYER